MFVQCEYPGRKKLDIGHTIFVSLSYQARDKRLAWIVRGKRRQVACNLTEVTRVERKKGIRLSSDWKPALKSSGSWQACSQGQASGDSGLQMQNPSGFKRMQNSLKSPGSVTEAEMPGNVSSL